MSVQRGILSCCLLPCRWPRYSSQTKVAGTRKHHTPCLGRLALSRFACFLLPCALVYMSLTTPIASATRRRAGRHVQVENVWWATPGRVCCGLLSSACTETTTPRFSKAPRRSFIAGRRSVDGLPHAMVLGAGWTDKTWETQPGSCGGCQRRGRVLLGHRPPHHHHTTRPTPHSD